VLWEKQGHFGISLETVEEESIVDIPTALCRYLVDILHVAAV
jgi:hypothetical protein